MERNQQKNGLINLLLLLLVGIATFAVARTCNSLAGQVITFCLGLGVMVCFVSWFQMRLETQEKLEKLEFDEITKSGTGGALFNSQESETFPARRSREQFEKYFVPAFSVILFLCQAGGAWWLWRWLSHDFPPVQKPLVAMSFLGILALILFLLGKYSAGVARLQKQRLLQPQASYLLLSSYLCALVVTGMAVIAAGYPKVDSYLARGLVLLLGLLSFESLIALVLEIYRPRIKGKVGPPLYESRLIGLLGHPEGLLSTAAHALDYQFGFKVSETWIYKSLEQALTWLIPLQLGALLVSSCFVVINPGEKALLERFGRLVEVKEQGAQAVLIMNPGLHVKWPWPVDIVYRYQTEQIQNLTIGFVPGEGEHEEHEETLLWTASHSKEEEFRLLVATRESAPGTNIVAGKKSPPVNLLSVSIPVQYQITNILAWAYNYREADKLLEKISTREVVHYLVNADLQEIMSSARFSAGEELRRRIQTQVDSDHLNLGVKILAVGLADVHPPVQVAASYENVVAAQHKGRADVLSSQAYHVRTNSFAVSEALKRTREAEAQQVRLSADAAARAALFTNQMPAYKVSPEVYTLRAYMQTLERNGSGARKVVLATTNAQNVILLNLEEKFRPDLGDLTMPATKSK